MPVLSLQIVLLMALLAPLVLRAGPSVGSPSATARVRIQVSIPPLVRVMENRFPATLALAPQGTHVAAQTLVVSTNLRSGFCLTLRTDAPSPGGWRIRSVGDDPVQIDAQGDGWRVCAGRLGLHTLRLQHEFDAPNGLAWPVRTELTLL